MAKTDDLAVLELMNASFGKQFSPDWLRWYEEGPHGPNRYRVIADHTADPGSKRRLIAGYGLLPIEIWLNGRIWKASLCQNVCTRPDRQRKGLFTALGRQALKMERRHGSRISLGMPNTKAVRGHVKVGWEELVPLSFYWKKPSDDLHPAPATLAEESRFGSDVDPFLREVEKGRALTLSKDHRWLNWRLVERPGYENRIFVNRRAGDVTGYCVAKRYEDKAHILDIQAFDRESFGLLVRAAEGYARGQRELNVWTNPLAPYRAWFEELGYEERSSDDRLIIHTNYGERVKVQDGPIDFTLSDNDVY